MANRPASEPHWAAWQRLGWETWSLWMEAASVIWLRSLRLAAGGAKAEREVERMVLEKIDMNWELGRSFLAGGQRSAESAASDTLKLYRNKVRANRRRLTR